MTILDCFKAALALHSTNTGEDSSLQQYAVPWANMALGEMLNAENSIRESRGEEILESAPIVLSASEEFPYSHKLNNALIYYMASNISKDDDASDWAQAYYNRYVTEVRSAMVYNAVPIVDVYGEADE